MATFVMFTAAGNASAAMVVNVEQITHILEWRGPEGELLTRIHTSDGEYVYVREDFNRVIDKIRGEK
jgi:hypothetical protein